MATAELFTFTMPVIAQDNEWSAILFIYIHCICFFLFFLCPLGKLPPEP